MKFNKNILLLFIYLFLHLGDNSELGSSLQKMAQTVATAISSGSETVNSGEGAEFQAAIAQALKDISATSENLQVSISNCHQEYVLR